MEVLKGFGNLCCKREQELALELFTLLKDGKLSSLAEHNFDSSSCDIYFNTSSGYVFLCDEDNNCLMESEGELDLFISTPYEGREGFFNEIMEEWRSLSKEDKEYMFEISTEELRIKYKKEFKKFQDKI